MAPARAATRPIAHAVVPARAVPLPGLALAWLAALSLAGVLLLLVAPQAATARAVPLLALVLLPAAALWLVQRAGVAGGSALALLAAAIVLCSDATLRGTPEGGLDLQSLAKFSLWVLGLLLWCWRSDVLRRACGHAPTAWLGAYGLWCLLGSAWSVTPLYTAGAALAWLGLWTVAVVLADTFTPHRAALVLGAALAVAMALSLALGVLAPALAYTPMDNGRVLRLSGLFASPNNLGRAAALLLVLAAVAGPALRRGPALLLPLAAGALGTAGLLLSDSRSALAALVLAIAVAVLGRRPWALLALVLAAACGLLLLAVAPGLAGTLAEMLARQGGLEEVSTLTGRTEIWAASWRLIEQAPLLGHGFASSRELLPAAWHDGHGWTTTSAHNLWLQAWLGTGAVGLLLVLGAQATWLWQALHQPHALRDAVVVLVLAIGLTEAAALGPSVNLMSFVWMWALALNLRARHG
jgi:O-antigen ligase